MLLNLNLNLTLTQEQAQSLAQGAKDPAVRASLHLALKNALKAYWAPTGLDHRADLGLTLTGGCRPWPDECREGFGFAEFKTLDAPDYLPAGSHQPLTFPDGTILTKSRIAHRGWAW